jgi:hypothetical protein
MTEAEWRASTDLLVMLVFLRGKVSERKSRLFACACCRLVWHLLPDHCRRLVEAVERYADNETRPGDLAALFAGYHPHRAAAPGVPGGNQAAEAVGHLGWQSRRGTDAGGERHWLTSGDVARSAAESLAKSIPWREARRLERRLLQDICGPLPFRPVSADPSWLSWNGGTVPKVAKAIYQERAYDRLPVLADALEEAGCTDQEVLEHCRGPGPHARGCWVLDLLLGKE